MCSTGPCTLHCKNSSVTSTPNLLYTHTYFHFGVPMEQIRCAGHTTVFTVYVPNIFLVDTC